MFRFLEDKFKDIIIFLVLILVLISITTTHRLENKLRWYDKAVLFITTPLEYALDGLISGTINFSNNYIFLIKTKADNNFLLEQNRKLNKELNRLQEIDFENQRLRRLLLFKEQISYFMLPAQVFARDASLEFESIRINKGSNTGVRKGLAVLNYDGVVGIVVRVASSFSDVLLVTDPNFSIDAMVQRSRVRGIVKGRSSDISEMKYLDRLDDVVVGDTIISSGFSGYFPKGVIIGTVTKIDKNTFGVTQYVEVKPTVNFNKLEEVFINFEGK